MSEDLFPWELLAKPETATWTQLCEWLTRHPLSKTQCSRLERALETWPDTLRVAPRDWLQQRLRGKLPQAWWAIRCLDLSCEPLTRETLTCARQHKLFEGIRVLLLWDAGLQEDTLRRLLEEEALCSLHTLQLGWNLLDERGAKALAEGPYLRSLTSLQLYENRIGAQGMEALSASQGMPGLRHLNVCNNCLGPEGAQALANASQWPAMRSLHLGFNQLQDEGASALLVSPHFPKLEELNIKYNDYTDQTAEAFGATHTMPALKDISLEDNALGAQGLAACTKNPVLRQLRRLHLGHCQITGPALLHFLVAQPMPALRHLDISLNPLGDESVAQLQKHPLFSQLETLNLREAGLSEAEKRRCIQAAEESGLHTLVL